MTVLLIIILLGCVVMIARLAHRSVGPSVFGVPAMIALFAFWAFGPALLGLGPVGILGVLAGGIVVWLVIGMAVTIGRDRDDSGPGALGP